MHRSALEEQGDAVVALMGDILVLALSLKWIAVSSGWGFSFGTRKEQGVALFFDEGTESGFETDFLRTFV